MRTKLGVKPSNLHFKGEKAGGIYQTQILDVNSHSTGRKVKMTFYHNGESVIPQAPQGMAEWHSFQE